MIEHQQIAGVILAGGLSRRMGGKDKGLVELAGKPLIAHVHERLAARTSAIVVNANGDPARFAMLGLPVQPDTVPGFAGPLAGILAAMRWSASNHGEARFLVSVAADTPFFPPDLVTRLQANHDGSDDMITLARSNGQCHPVFALWPLALADAVEAFLAIDENRKVMQFIGGYRYLAIDFPLTAKGHDPFFNINEPSDLALAESMAQEAEIG